MARLNVISLPATGFEFTIDTTPAKTPYYSDYPDGTTITVTWPETQSISSRGLLLSRDLTYAFQRMAWDKNVVEANSASIKLATGTTSVNAIYRRSAVTVKGPLGIWWFPIVSRIFGAPRV